MLNRISVASLNQRCPYFIVFTLKRSVAFAHHLKVVRCEFDEMLIMGPKSARGSPEMPV